MANVKSMYKELSSVKDDIIERASRVRLLLMDVDGVLTDGNLYYIPLPDGTPVEFKGLNSHDGLGFHFLNRVGIKTGVISGRVSFATTERSRILKITYVYQDKLEKEDSYEEILKKARVDASQVCYIGDDFTDAPLIIRSGLGCAVADARPELHVVADYITTATGGRGAVREVIELILKSQNLWEGVLRHYHLKPE